MASFSGELRVGGLTFSLHSLRYEATQATDERGRVVGKVRNHFVFLTCDVPEHNFLESWAFSPSKRLAADIVVLDAEGGQTLETVSMAAAFCVGYEEWFETGDTHNGSYRARLQLSDPTGWTWQKGGPGAYIAPAARDHGVPEAPPVTGVKPIGSLALDLVRMGLTPAEANYVKLGAQGVLDKELLHQGAKALTSVGGNYQALLAITDSGKTVEIMVANSFETQTTPKPVVFGSVEYENEFDQMWSLEKTQWQAGGGTLKTYQKEHPNYSHTNMWSGFRAVTLVPDEAGGYGKAKSPNLQVILNADYRGANARASKKIMTSTLAHETYGHALFKIQGKRWEHGKHMAPGPNSDYNTALQTQINQRVDEAERNFDRRAPK